MKLIQKLRKFWHDAYYAIAPRSAREFAMRCQDVAAQVDIPDSVDTPQKKLQHLLHMSLCQACRNYRGYSQWLNHEATLIKVQEADSSRIEKLNARLLEIHSKSKKT